MLAESAAPASTAPTFHRESAAYRAGSLRVAGVDEAGRGPLAGPVVVSAVVLNRRRIPDGLDDSKKLTADQRETLFEIIMRQASVSVVVAPPSLIARLNIRGATLWAMRQAVTALGGADHALFDGRDVPPGLNCHGEAVIGGDGLCVSIAAASIVAKVTRDRMCQVMHCDEPDFGFGGHKGYGTPEHLAALDRHGPGRHHRMDFAPVALAHARRAELASTD